MEPNTTIKLVIFNVQNDQLTVLLSNNQLIQGPFETDTSLDNAAKEIFTKITKLSLDKNYIEQLYTISEKSTQQISIIYYLLLPQKDLVSTNNVTWQSITDISKKMPDFSIIQYAIQRLRWKIEYTNVVYSLLSETFTLSQLQKTYEAILGEKLDKRNFRKKILSLDFLMPTGKTRTKGSRPAQIYQFKKREPVIVKVFS